MPQQSVRPEILRRWANELRAWDGDPSTAEALTLRLEQIAAGLGVSLEHYRQAWDPASDWTQDRERRTAPDLTDVRERLRTNREQPAQPTETEDNPWTL